MLSSLKNLIPRLPHWMLYAIYRIMLWRARNDIRAIEPAIDHYMFVEEKRIRMSRFPVQTESLHIVGMIGLPQTGKSTVASVFAHEGGFFRINANHIRGWLIDAGLDYSNLNAIPLYMMERALRDGFNVVIDSDNVLPVKWAFYKMIAKRAGAQSRRIRVWVDYEEWRQRVAENARRGAIHRMYADGVRRDDPQFKAERDIPPWRIAKCVHDEYNRQAPNHGPVLDPDELYVFHNGDEKHRVEAQLRDAVYQFLRANGTHATREWVEKMYFQTTGRGH